MTQPSAPPAIPDSGMKMTRYRWVICGLLFAATTINYMDRSVMNVVGPTIRDKMGWSDVDYGLVSAAFTLAYAIGFIIMGKVIDALGTRITYAGALIFWSLAAAGHALTGTPFTFGIARFFLGLGESGNFPAAVKTVAEWFPQKERATATGIFNAGSNVGAILAPLLVPLIVKHFGGWQAAFVATGLIGLLWVFFWLPMYRSPMEHPRVNQAERDYILGGDRAAVTTGVKEPPVKWRNLLPHRQAWAFIMGKLMTDPVWYFYNFFGGLFFADKFGVGIDTIGIPLIIIYLLADVGSIAGGWLSSTLIHRGWTPNAARKTAMFTCACFVLPVIFAPLVPAKTWMMGTFDWGVVVSATLIGIAASAHQGFSANIFTLTSDLFPKKAVGSVVGLGSFAGSMGGVFMGITAGLIKEIYGDFVIMFIGASGLYLLAVLVVHLLVPGFKRLNDDQLVNTRVPVPVWCVIWAIVGLVAGMPLSYEFQNKTDYRVYDFKAMVTNTYARDWIKNVSPERKLLIASSKADDSKKALTTQESAALLADSSVSRDFREILERKDIAVKPVNFVLEFKDNIKDEDLAALRGNFHVTESDSTYTQKSEVDGKKIPAKLTVPFRVAGTTALEKHPKGFSFREYFSAVLTQGKIFTSYDRAHLLPPLWHVPLGTAAAMAVLGALMHGVILRRRAA